MNVENKRRIFQLSFPLLLILYLPAWKQTKDENDYFTSFSLLLFCLFYVLFFLDFVDPGSLSKLYVYSLHRFVKTRSKASFGGGLFYQCRFLKLWLWHYGQDLGGWLPFYLFQGWFLMPILSSSTPD